jgi:signal transduction histidine kinase
MTHGDSFMNKIRSSLEGLLELALNSELPPEQEPLRELLDRHVRSIHEAEAEIRQRTAQLEQSLRYQAMLGRIIDRVRDSLNENQILQTVIQELAQGLDLEGCDTSLYDWEMNATIVHRYGWQQREVDVTGIDARHVTQFCSLQHRHTVLLCPVIDHQEVFSDLLLYRQSHETFDELEVDFVQRVASQCAIAIRQARLHQATQAQVKELERLNQAKDEFLSTVSYELRIPMSNMKMAIEMLKVSLTRELNEQEASKTFRYLQVLQNECDREAKLIEDLLDLQQLDTDSLSLVVSAEPLDVWLPYIVEPLQEKFQERQLDFQIEIEPDLPLLMCDLNSLSRIVLELLNNAYKYTPANEKVIVNAKKLINLEKLDQPSIEITVCNTGVEIPMDDIEQIFDKFYRIEKIDIRNEGGTGLGLALVQRLLERLNGKIEVKSEHSQTCFTLVLPLS